MLRFSYYFKCMCVFFLQLRSVHGESQIHLVLAKVKKESWAAHSRHFTQIPV